MSVVLCTRRLQFCAGHRVFGHENKCAHLHGHNYVVEISACSTELDSQGRVIDFSVLKQEIGQWIETYWDHGFILNVNDVDARNAVSNFPARKSGGATIVPQKIYIMPYNPTAENIALYLLHEICPKELKQFPILVTMVKVHETENCTAVAILTDEERKRRWQELQDKTAATK